MEVKKRELSPDLLESNSCFWGRRGKGLGYLKKLWSLVVYGCKRFVYNRGYYAGDCEGYRDGVLNLEPDTPLPTGPGAFSRGLRDGYEDGWQAGYQKRRADQAFKKEKDFY